MTRVSGRKLIASPCCHKLYAITSYASINYSSSAFWTDGKRDGSLMPNDSGLRKCKCEKFFLQSEAVKLEIPAGDDREFAPHVHTSDLKHSHSGRRTFLTTLANKGTAIHILKTLAGHRSISTTAAYLYSSPSQLKAAVELV